MGTDKTIQVLLSTYNGEKYLRRQLESIISQDCFSQIKILVRDDGSTDKTVEILKKYRERYSCIDIIQGENIGINRSYFELLSNADRECKYFAFSDQDDVWFPFKLRIAVEYLDKMGNEDIPCLYSSRSELVNENTKHIGEIITPKKGVGFYNAVAQNVMPGHTQVFNRKAMTTIADCGYSSAIYVIDWWFYLVMSCIGNVYFDNTITVKHRQHSNNSIGYDLNVVRHFISRVKRAFSEERYKPTLQLQGLWNLYREIIKTEYKAELNNYLTSLANLPDRIHYISKSKIYRQSAFETLLYKILFISGKFNP